MKEIIVIQKEMGDTQILLCDKGELKEFYEEQENKQRLEGNIYLGKVENILSGMQAAFVDIGEEKNTFIHLKDILPKMDAKVSQEEIQRIEQADIKQYVKPGQTMLVQIKRDASQQKGARVSTHINLTNRLTVLMPKVPFITISQKIEEKKERERLLEIGRECLPEGFGLILRTASQGKKKQQIKQDIQEMVDVWEDIQKKALQEKAPALLYKNQTILEKMLKDLGENQVQTIMVNQESLQRQIQELVGNNSKILVKQVEDPMKLYDLEKQLIKKDQRKIWLKCGGFITIEQTEALTAIDVNTGKYIGKTSLEETVFKVNQEASLEIAKQIRLRDIGGMILIDYIDMKQEENKKAIIELLQNQCKEDRSKTQILGFTKLNLLEMTRKHLCT